MASNFEITPKPLEVEVVLSEIGEHGFLCLSSYLKIQTFTERIHLCTKVNMPLVCIFFNNNHFSSLCISVFDSIPSYPFLLYICFFNYWSFAARIFQCSAPVISHTQMPAFLIFFTTIDGLKISKFYFGNKYKDIRNGFLALNFSLAIIELKINYLDERSQEHICLAPCDKTQPSLLA